MFNQLINTLAEEREVNLFRFISHHDVMQKLARDPELRDWLVTLRQNEQALKDTSSQESRKTLLLALWIDQEIVDVTHNRADLTHPDFSTGENSSQVSACQKLLRPVAPVCHKADPTETLYVTGQSSIDWINVWISLRKRPRKR